MLDNTKVENVRSARGKTTGRCPACKEEGRDDTGDHLVMFSDGSFACIAHPGAAGAAHRQRIFELVGIKTPEKKTERSIESAIDWALKHDDKLSGGHPPMRNCR
jgi:hypothetical protein